MSLLSKKQPPTVSEISKVTGWSVAEIADFFGIDRRAVYRYNYDQEGRIPKGRHFELMNRRPELFENERED